MLHGVPWPKRPHHRGREGCGRVVERLGRQARTARGRAAFAGRELACGGLDGEGNGGVIERDEGELPERSRGARAPARARAGCDICYDMFCIL